MVRLWFNHWFSTAYHIINLIRESEPGRFHIIGSNAKKEALYRRACDEWFTEPDGLSEKDYVDFAVDFCAAHRVDVFVPRRNLAAIAENRSRFEALGVKLLCDEDSSLIRLLDDKDLTYRRISEFGAACVPPYRIADSAESFTQAVAEIGRVAERVCYKLTQDEGAQSFRIIDDRRVLGPKALKEKPGFKLTLAQATAVLEQYDFSVPMMVMPYLDGDEISADCMMTPTGPIVIPRFKTGKRYSIIRYDAEIIRFCTDLMEQLGLVMPCNIQFRTGKEGTYLLEINPRMSGGIQLSCLASGINLPGVAVHQLLGEQLPWRMPENLQPMKAANLETPILLGDI